MPSNLSSMLRSTPGRPTKIQLRIESLEVRQLLTAQPIISEFMAVNESTVQDEDGEFSDWIELFNVGDEPAEMLGYALTDDATDLTKWRLPGVTLNPGERIVVYASNKDRSDAGSELHTNFRLSSAGEYLALVGADGSTIATDFGPSYPPQISDVSYGLSSIVDTSEILAPQAFAKYKVPTDNSLREIWFGTDFDDSAWTLGTTPIGYDAGGNEFSSFSQQLTSLGPLAYWQFNETSGTTADNSASNDGSLDGTYAGGADPSFTGPDAAVHSGFDATNSATDLDGGNDAITTGVSVLSDLSAFTMMGFIRPDSFASNRVGLFGQNDAIEFGFISPNTLQIWTPNGGSLNVDYTLPRNEWHHVAVVGTGSELKMFLDGELAGSATSATNSYGDSTFGFNIGGEGIFDATGNNFDGAIDEVAIFDKALTNQQIADLMNPSADNSSYTDILGSDIGALMPDISSSAYVRIGFNVDDPAMLSTLSMETQYDDGFIAYVNGAEIARVNVPGEDDETLGFNATALTSHPDSEALQFVAIDITDARDALLPGDNTLSVHLLNVSADNSDALFTARILGGRVNADFGNAGYLTTPTPGTENPPSTGDLGPLVSSVAHTPHQPSKSDPVVVTAAVNPTLHPVSKVELNYRVMFDPATTLTMVDNGIGADAIAGDGIYTATIPGNIANEGEMLRWSVHTTDTETGTGRLPLFEFNSGRNQTAEYFGTVISDADLSSDIGIIQWFSEEANRAGTRSGTRASLYYNGEFYDNLFVRQRGGSTAGQPKTNFKFDFKGDTFRFDPQYPRVEEFNLNSTASDKAYVRQPMAFEAYAELGTPSSISFPVNVQRNGEFYGTFVFIEEPDEEMLARNGLDPDGALYKFYNEFTSASGARKKTREYESGSADLAEFVREVNSRDGQDLVNYLYDNVDIPTTLNYLVGTVITHQNDNPHKNHFLYRDTNISGEWTYIPWDNDLTWGSNWVGTSYSDEIYADDDSVSGKAPNIQPSHPFINTSGYREWNNHWNRLMDALLNVDSIKEMFLRRLRSGMDQLLGEPGTTDSYLDRRFDEYLALTAPDAALDKAEWFTPWRFGTDQSMADAIEVIKTEYLEVRRRHLYVTHGVDQLNQAEPAVFVPEFANSSFFVPTDNSLGTDWTEVGFDDSAWMNGMTGVGFQNGTTFDGLLNSLAKPTDHVADGTSIFVRIPFDLENAASIENLTLKMKFDDGFVAYINGERVADSNLRDDTTNYNSRGRGHSNAAAQEFENFVISLASHPNLLDNGENVLAIHGMNSSVTSNDMLILPELVEGIVTNTVVAGIPHAQVGNPGMRFDAVNYEAHPASGNQDEEYIKLDNPTDQAADISGWKLQGGVDHTFKTGTVIPAGGSLYVSPNVRAFRSRTSGPSGNQGLFIQGNYQGHLSRLGETVQLVASDGEQIDALEIPADPTDTQRFLRITEVHYNPAGLADETEFIELKNISTTTTLDLSGVKITDGPSEPFVFADGTTLLPGAYTVVVGNLLAFTTAYPSVPASGIGGQFVGGLANGGERIKLDDATNNTIVDFRYNGGDPWSARADGAGASLTLVADETPVELLNKWYSWSGSTRVGGTPAQAADATIGVRINEVFANSEPPAIDAIELLNNSASSVDVSGWYLSDSSNDLLKYQIPADTRLAPGATLVINEAEFNPTPDTPAANHFALNSNGDDVFLVIPDGEGGVQSIVDDVHFRDMRTGESLGRLASNQGRLEPLQIPTLGSTSAIRRNADVLISEVQYNPGAPSADALAIHPTLDSSDLEYVEVVSVSSSPVDLSGWRLRGGADFGIADGTIIPQFGTLLVVGFNPGNPDNAARLDAFRTHYGIDNSVAIQGGLSGRLGDSFDRVQLQSPGAAPANDPTNVPYYFEDEVLYDDLAPWPNADGNGMTLSRIDLLASGNDPRSWIADVPTPGGYTIVDLSAGDFNGDGEVDDADIDMLCVAIRTGQNGDQFDLNDDAVIDIRDQRFLVETILRTTLGDSDLDGKFNSTDFVRIFQVGEYEDGIAGNSGWSEGDWNCDGDFGTADFVAAFQAGGYVAAAVAINGDNGAALVGAILDHQAARTDTDTDDHASKTETRHQDQPMARRAILDPFGGQSADDAIRELFEVSPADRDIDEIFDEVDVRAFIP